VRVIVTPPNRVCFTDECRCSDTINQGGLHTKSIPDCCSDTTNQGGLHWRPCRINRNDGCSDTTNQGGLHPTDHKRFWARSYTNI